ncbi:FadR/GntR family transcriptional regulator [Kineococcus rhizosphaerae]|uniref:DNA-binding FadR family transcriptional regulator n=1 Tax=Kineococcus rhizosphaerae TaxID=559628 RepID=A0A2T0R0Y4_9ACTN|nr:FCD domain-containing protein [Kineococcus rhizosphaerae]PRY12891.1 DNA-binding FadR family transcriptional regulator [Kineococcus rhizosphaerae]
MTTRTQHLVDVLRFRIVEGELVPGQAVPSESELVGEFGVSRTVVREAMSRLQAAGLVETLRGKGSFVLARPSEESFGVDVAGLRSVPERVELLEFRLAVETEAAALAAARRDEGRLDALRRAATAFADAADRPADAVGADFRFHAAVAAASGNRYLLDVLRTLGEPMIAMPAARLRSGTDTVADVVAEHDTVLRAVERGDVETARAAMRVHLANSIARLARR